MVVYPDITNVTHRQTFGERLEDFVEYTFDTATGNLLPTVLSGSRAIPVHDKGGAAYHMDAYASAGSDTARLLAAAAAALAAGGGRVIASRPTVDLAGLVKIPAGVNLEGAGSGKTGQGQGTRFLCSAADAELRFGDYGVYERGGRSGNFIVDGADIALRPMTVVGSVHRTFDTIDVRRGVTSGLYLYGCQNCYFPGITIDDCLGDGLVFDVAANGHTFPGLRISGCGRAAGTNLANIKFTCSGAAPPALVTAYPQNNQLDNFMIERGGGFLAAQIWYGAGQNNYISGNVTNTSNGTGEPAIRTNIDDAVNAGAPINLNLEKLNVFSNNSPRAATAFDLADSTSIRIHGGVRIFNYLYALRLRGSTTRIKQTAAIEEAGVTTFLDPASTGTMNGCVLTEFSNRTWYTIDSAANAVIEFRVRGDVGVRGHFLGNGDLRAGDGAGFTPDTHVGRTSANVWGAKTAGDSLKVSADGLWTSPFWFGGYALWIDTSGRLRVKSGAPTSDTDGTVVGTQS